jgi:hypothetical protein
MSGSSTFVGRHLLRQREKSVNINKATDFCGSIADSGDFFKFIAEVEIRRVSAVTNLPAIYFEILSLNNLLSQNKRQMCWAIITFPHSPFTVVVCQSTLVSCVINDSFSVSKGNHTRQNRLEIITFVKQLRHKEIRKLRLIISQTNENFLFLSVADRFFPREFFSKLLLLIFVFFLVFFSCSFGQKQIHESKVIVSRK